MSEIAKCFECESEAVDSPGSVTSPGMVQCLGRDCGQFVLAATDAEAIAKWNARQESLELARRVKAMPRGFDRSSCLIHFAEHGGDPEVEWGWEVPEADKSTPGCPLFGYGATPLEALRMAGIGDE